MSKNVRGTIIRSKEMQKKKKKVFLNTVVSWCHLEGHLTKQNQFALHFLQEYKTLTPLNYLKGSS